MSSTFIHSTNSVFDAGILFFFYIHVCICYDRDYPQSMISHESVWKLRVVGTTCEQSNCPLLKDCPLQVMSVSDVIQIISLLDSASNV